MSKLTPMKAIRKKCLDCCCGQRLEVKLCTCKIALCMSIEWGKDRETIKVSKKRIKLINYPRSYRLFPIERK